MVVILSYHTFIKFNIIIYPVLCR